MTRRKLLKRAVAGAAAVTMWRNTALSAQNVIGANDRINVGLIGAGGRGRLVAGHMVKAPNVAVTAICDISDQTIEQGKAAEFAARDAQGYKDFRRVLDRNDIHALLVATPDHWHAIPTVLGCAAGKDVYVEKPLALTIEEGRKMVAAARKHNRIVTCGMQHRAAPHYKEVEEIIQRGEIGDVHFVRVWNYGASAGAQGYEDSEVPPGVDWDMYLGPAPKVPFNQQRFQGTYRRFYDYSGGYITDFGAHRLDSVHQVMHDDRPLSAMAVGGLYVKTGQADTPDVLHVTYEYKNWILSYEGIQLNPFGGGPRIPNGRVPYNAGPQGPFARPHGEAFYGTRGTIFSDRVGYEVFMSSTGGGRRGRGGGGGGGAPAPEPKSVEGADRTDLLALNFIESMRSRKASVCDVETGHKSTIVPHLGNISYKIGGRKIIWDPDTERIVGDADASKLLSKEARKPYDLI